MARRRAAPDRARQARSAVLGAPRGRGGGDARIAPAARPPGAGRGGHRPGAAAPAGADLWPEADAPQETPALRHLAAADPRLAELIRRDGPIDLAARRRGRPTDAYGALVRSIVGQQLSTKAARSIFERLIGLWDGRAPTPAELLAADPEHVRAIGLSRAKVAYLRDLAARVEDGELELDRLAELPDEEVAAQLVAVKGLGQWTVDMFLIFHLGRPDVLPVGDLGIRRAVERLYGLPGLPDAAELRAIAEPWRPERSLACLVLWRSLDNAPV